MKTSSWFDALALLVISLMSITVGAMTDARQEQQARTVQMTPGNR
jgi:hypothetical protein